jgi:hypothetical protein
LVIDKSWIDPESIHMTPNIEDAPMLSLMSEAINSGMGLIFAGG